MIPHLYIPGFFLEITNDILRLIFSTIGHLVKYTDRGVIF